MQQVHEFWLEDIEILRDAAARVSDAVPGVLEFGEELDSASEWRKLTAAPRALLDGFPSLNLRDGYELRAYVFSTGMNGWGGVFAAESGSEFPDAEDAEWVPRNPDGKSRLPSDDSDQVLMEAIAGDGSPRSLLEASIFLREANEFGAEWHGCEWSVETVLGGIPGA